jgi:hypothetical protein
LTHKYGRHCSSKRNSSSAAALLQRLLLCCRRTNSATVAAVAVAVKPTRLFVLYCPLLMAAIAQASIGCFCSCCFAAAAAAFVQFHPLLPSFCLALPSFAYRIYRFIDNTSTDKDT